MSNIEAGEDEEVKRALSAKNDDKDIDVSENNTAPQTQTIAHLDRNVTNPIDDMERLLNEFDKKEKGEEGRKGDDEDEENDGNLTRLVDKI